MLRTKRSSVSSSKAEKCVIVCLFVFLLLLRLFLFCVFFWLFHCCCNSCFCSSSYVHLKMKESFIEKIFLQVEVLRVRLGLADLIWQRFPNLLFLKENVPLFCAIGQSVLLYQRRAEFERSEQSKELVSSSIIVSLVCT